MTIQDTDKGASAAPKPKRKYKKKSQATAPAPSMKEVSAAQPGNKNISSTESPLHQFILDKLKSGQSKANVLDQAINMNRQQEEPVSNDEVLAQVEKLFATLDTEMSDEDLLFKLADELITTFNDDLSEPYFFCESIPFRAPSKHVEALVKHRFYLTKKYMPHKKVVRSVFDILESQARFDAPKVRMFNRVGKKDGAFYYDHCDKRFLKITSSGWEMVPALPLFRRYKHQQVQVEPVSGGDVWEVFKFLTISENDQLLVLVFLISLFIPGIAHPILAVSGDQGSAKSFLCNIINRLIDPTLTERIIQPKNERDLIQTLRQKYVTVLDNISKIDQRVSDILCQVCTGGGVSYRQLYTDEGENIAQFRHVVIINSITMPIVNADLMDRAIILKLQRIKPENRRPEQDLWHAFNIAQPKILGGIFDIIVKAMENYPTVKIDKLPRLADFAKWGYAIAEALGKSGDQFLEDFSNNVKHQNESVVEKNVLCQAIIGLMEDRSNHLNTVSEVGVVRAGMPQPPDEDIQEYYSIDRNVARIGGTFFLRVKGDSMINAAICEGDLALIRPQEVAQHRDIVVALVDGEATLKRFYREPDYIRLQPENPNYAPIIIREGGSDISIVGKVVGIYRSTD